MNPVPECLEDSRLRYSKLCNQLYVSAASLASWIGQSSSEPTEALKYAGKPAEEESTECDESTEEDCTTPATKTVAKACMDPAETPLTNSKEESECSEH